MQMDEASTKRMGIDQILKAFVWESHRILEENLVGVYLHGSAAMECFNEKKSDIDLLVVTERELSGETKLRYMDMVVRLNENAPPKGIEMSVVRKDVCKPFVYPTPFELHFSVAHLDWYRRNPAEYIQKMQGVDRDLAAHVTVTLQRGKCLYGKPISEVFGPVQSEFYWDSIWNDVADAEDVIQGNPAYVILNLCRVLAYGTEGLILSKREGGEWGIANLPMEYHGLIASTLAAYLSDAVPQRDDVLAGNFAADMLDRIRNCAVRGTSKRLQGR